MAEENANVVFREFMAVVGEVDKLQGIDGQTLRKFQQELELARRPPLDQQSEVIARVFQDAPSPRLAMYAEAGGHHSYSDKLNLLRLDSAIRSLRTHRTQACALIKELEGKVEQVTAIAKDDLEMFLSRSVTLESARDVEDDALTRSGRSSTWPASDYAVFMGLLLQMIRQDYSMQETIIAALGFHTPSEPLESYCTMWTLRPYVDEGIFREALEFVDGK